MADFHGDQTCVTHHACDCILAERDRLRAALVTIERMISIDPDEGWSLRDIQEVHAIAEAALSEGAPDG